MRQNQTISVTTSSGMFLSRDIRAENRKNLALYDVKHNLCDTGRSNSNDFKYIIAGLSASAIRETESKWAKKKNVRSFTALYGK